jgi:hypothetical protein
VVGLSEEGFVVEGRNGWRGLHRCYGSEKQIGVAFIMFTSSVYLFQTCRYTCQCVVQQL